MVREHEKDVCPRRPVEVQVASLIQQFAVVTVELKKLRENHKRELCEVKEDQKRELDELKQELAEVKKENDQLRKMQDTFVRKAAFATLEQKCALLEIHRTPILIPPFYFSVSDVRQYFKTEDCKVCSEQFYSHPGGYKMFVSIDISLAKGYLSLYIHICRGEFDDKLKWPFDGRITIQAYNRTTEKWSNQQTIVMKCGRSITRCKEALEYGNCGYEEYIQLSQIHHYIVYTEPLGICIRNVEIVP